ncbi:hotdog fold thioesterase [Arthrobacter sp. NamB2]|nr:hotdog fold thioesterase [Arthrobacter sp. NamB2]
MREPSLRRAGAGVPAGASEPSVVLSEGEAMVRVAAGLVVSLTGASLVAMTDNRTQSDVVPAPDEETLAELLAAGIPPEMHGWLGRYGVGALTVKMGIVFREMSAERMVATMPVEGNQQVAGILHGGAHVVLAETLGSFAAGLHAGPGRQAMGIEVGATHHRSISSGLVTGTATAIHLGRTLTTHEVVMTDDQGRRLSTARITNMIRDARD